MRKLFQLRWLTRNTVLLLLFVSNSCPDHVAQQSPATLAEAAIQALNTRPTQTPNTRSTQASNEHSTQTPNARPTFLKAFIIDDRLSALRRKPGLQAQVIRRLRIGHAVYVVGTAKVEPGQPRFYRIAVTRRTRGWIHQSAVAVQTHAGEDQRIMNLIEAADSVDRISLCKLLCEHFGKSKLVPRAMLLLGEESERVAETLSQRTRRRLADVRGAVAKARDYYLSDPGLDRFSKLGVVFDFNESSGEFVYDGKFYRELIRRFPASQEARLARQHLELIGRMTPQR